MDTTTQAVSSQTPLIPETERVSPRVQRTHFIGFAIFVGLLVLAFGKPFVALAQLAARSDLHSHTLLVPFVSAYLLYVRRSQLPRNYEWSLGWAAISFLIGAASVSWAWINNAGISRTDFLAVMMFAFICFLLAGAFTLLGRGWVRAATFPLFFLAFMIPIPDAIAYALETASKLGSAETANFFFNITGTPVLREGVVFQLPGIAIQVARECSGIRSSWVLLITSLLAANLFLNTTWHRVVLVAFVIPLGLIRNGFRVFVIGTLCIHYGPQMIDSVIHHHGGPFFFVLSLIPLFLLLFWLNKAETRRLRSSRAR